MGTRGSTRSSRCPAVSAMRRPMHKAQKPHCLVQSRRDSRPVNALGIHHQVLPLAGFEIERRIEQALQCLLGIARSEVLKCGLHAQGVLRASCEPCGEELGVATSFRRRGVLCVRRDAACATSRYSACVNCLDGAIKTKKTNRRTSQNPTS